MSMTTQPETDIPTAEIKQDALRHQADFVLEKQCLTFRRGLNRRSANCARIGMLFAAKWCFLGAC
jgi:hypothetical protein